MADSAFSFQLLNFDLHIHAGRQIELRERVHRLRPRIQNVDQPFVRLSSNCSRLFLSMCGLRSTVHSCRLVGSGMGPETCAPVFSAVRTMSAAAWSISALSNALRRMRIFPAIRYLDSSLLLDFGGDPGAHRAAALAHRDADPFLHAGR